MTSAVPSARLHARQVVREWGLPDLAETVELVVCELVTNAMQVSEGLNGSLFCGTWIVGLPSVRLWLEGSTRTVVVRVWGGSEAVPHTEKPDADIESGRGLMIVEALCARYGTYGVPGCSGKVVWGEVGRSQY